MVGSVVGGDARSVAGSSVMRAIAFREFVARWICKLGYKCKYYVKNVSILIYYIKDGSNIYYSFGVNDVGKWVKDIEMGGIILRILPPWLMERFFKIEVGEVDKNGNTITGWSSGKGKSKVLFHFNVMQNNIAFSDILNIIA